MAKNKKPSASSSSYNKKKSIPATSKKPVKKAENKIDDQKVGVIAEKLTKINKNFECLITECQNALKQLKLASVE